MIDNKRTKDEKFSIVKRAESFTHAGRGIVLFMKSTHNAWVHVGVLALTVVLGFVLKITNTEWIALILASGLVLVAEAFNTAIEIDINLTSPEYHPYARDTKDVAAGAVLLATLTAIIIGAFIFLPHIFTTRQSNTENRPETLTYVEPTGAFRFDYNPSFSVSSSSKEPTRDWRLNATTLGNVLTTVILPKSYMPGTNFSDAKLVFGRSSDVAAIGNCTQKDAGEEVVGETTLGNFPFIEFSKDGAAAGNYYEMTSYRGILDGDCYSIEYTIHSTNLDNYPPEMNIGAFDKTKIKSELEKMVHSFTFLVNSD